jgi:hypothetical protein
VIIIDGDMEVGFPAVLDSFRFAFEGICSLQQAPSFLDDHAPGMREGRAAAGPVEDLHARSSSSF